MKKAAQIKYNSTIGELPHLKGMHYIDVPPKVIKKLGSFRVRLICEVNGALKFQCGLMALGKGHGYITITKKRMKELHLEKGSKVKITLSTDSSKFGMKVCPELTEVLKQDSEGNRRFKLLKPGKQRNIIHFVGSAKSSDKRIERALRLIENLKLHPEGHENIGKILTAKSAI